MRFKPAGVLLVVPGIRAISRRPEKPQGVGSRPYPLAVNDALRQTNIAIAGSLVEIAFHRGFKSAGILKHHLIHVANISKIQAISQDTVHADIADHQHALFAFPFRFRTHQARQEPNVCGIRFNDGQIGSSSLSTERYILCASAYLGASDWKKIGVKDLESLANVNTVTILNISCLFLWTRLHE